MFNTEYYGKEYLKDADSEKVDEIELLRNEVLNAETIEEFLEDRMSLNGNTAKKLVRDEVLNPFLQFLGERFDIYLCDFIIAKIDDYTEDEYVALRAKAEEKKRLLLAGAND